MLFVPDSSHELSDQIEHQFWRESLSKKHDIRVVQEAYHKCFTLVDEDDLPCGKIWSQGSVWMWALDEESYWPADSESEAKQALLEAVGAEVITLPENLTTLENADTGHDQPKGA